MDFEQLLGKTLTAIDVNESNDVVIFTDTEGVQYKMYHYQDCCESVGIEDINGDINDLIGTPITLAEETCNSDNPKSETYQKGTPDEWTSTDESGTWTFYKLATVKGYVDIRWYGSSNGYYSESVSFVKIGAEDDN